MALETFPEEEKVREDKSYWHTSDRKQSDINEERIKLKSDLPVKVFCHRNSVLTDLMKVNHLQSVHNISIALFILLIINAILFYIATPSTFWTDIRIIMNASSKLSVFCIVWLTLNSSCAIVYYVFKWWTLQRIRHQKKNGILDSTLLLLYVIYLVSTFTVPAFCVVKFQVPAITTFALLSEQTRISMKIYSFVRENVSRVLKVNPKKGEKIQIESLCPTFHHFVYYLFAPTLIYRDSYPRTSTIRWRFVITNLLQVFACIFITYCIFHRFNVDVFRNVGRIKLTPSYLALTIAGSMVAGTLKMFLMFYGLLHCWMNAFAEMLRFGDRLFYQDWWNSTSFSQYYRMWNGVVYDWLYTYVHMELHKLGCNKITSMMMVFLISAFVHEFILSIGFGFCLPALFLIYSTVGVPMVFVTKRGKTQVWNIFMWALLFSGWGLLVFFYSTEWFARANCPRTLDRPLDYFVPRFWGCNILSLR